MVIQQLLDEPPIIQAIIRGDYEDLKALLEENKDAVNWSDSEKRTPLHAAAYKGDPQMTELLLLNGARVNVKDGKWITPLHRACCSRSEETVNILLNHGAEALCRDRLWQTPLHVAAAAGCSSGLVEQLLSAGAACHLPDRAGRTPLHHAAYHGSVDCAEALLMRGAVIDAADKRDCRPTHWAAYNGNEDMLRLLLSYSADVGVKDREQYTPLHVACSVGHGNLVQVLLEHGADINIRNSYGNTPLHLACLNGHDALIGDLIHAHADINLTNYRGQTPLHIVASCTYGEESMEILLREGVNVNVQSDDGRTPLHNTALHGRFTRSKTLIDRGAIVDLVDKNSCTALHIAALNGHESLANHLLAHGADPNRRGYAGRTPLHMCCLSGYVECCRKFLQHNVDIDSQDNTGKTPIHCAAFKGAVECLDLLVSSGANFQLADACSRLPLHYAAAGGRYACLFTLVGVGSPVNAQDVDGLSALHFAAAHDLEGKCVEYLIQHKADVNLKDNHGFTPIHYAVAGGNQTGLSYLLAVINTKYTLYGEGMPRLTPLHLAAYHGQNDILRLLLPLFSNVDLRDNSGKTPLDLAAVKGNRQCVQLLLRCGAHVNIADDITARTPVHCAVSGGHIDCLTLLLDNTEDRAVVNRVDVKGRTALALAVASGYNNCVAKLRKCGADPNIADSDQHTPLFRAVVQGNVECVEMLLSDGARLDFRDCNGKTVFHLAAACGQLQCLTALSDACGTMLPAALAVQDNQHCTVLHWACYNGYSACLEYLLEKNVFKSLEGNIFSPVHCAAFQGSEQCLELLINAFGATNIIGLRDARGRTPLHLAAFHNSSDCIQLLLTHGAKSDEVDHSGKTPLIAAAHNGQLNALEILINWDADISKQDNYGNTALHVACARKHTHVALALLNMPAEGAVNIVNKELKTPLHIAARNGLIRVTEQLLIHGANVFATDNNGLTPALCCAPDASVAQCLALILSATADITIENKYSGFLSSYLSPLPSDIPSCDIQKTDSDKFGSPRPVQGSSNLGVCSVDIKRKSDLNFEKSYTHSEKQYFSSHNNFAPFELKFTKKYYNFDSEYTVDKAYITDLFVSPRNQQDDDMIVEYEDDFESDLDECLDICNHDKRYPTFWSFSGLNTLKNFSNLQLKAAITQHSKQKITEIKHSHGELKCAVESIKLDVASESGQTKHNTEEKKVVCVMKNFVNEIIDTVMNISSRQSIPTSNLIKWQPLINKESLNIYKTIDRVQKINLNLLNDIRIYLNETASENPAVDDLKLRLHEVISKDLALKVRKSSSETDINRLKMKSDMDCVMDSTSDNAIKCCMTESNENKIYLDTDSSDFVIGEEYICHDVLCSECEQMLSSNNCSVNEDSSVVLSDYLKTNSNVSCSESENLTNECDFNLSSETKDENSENLEKQTYLLLTSDSMELNEKESKRKKSDYSIVKKNCVIC